MANSQPKNPISLSSSMSEQLKNYLQKVDRNSKTDDAPLRKYSTEVIATMHHNGVPTVPARGISSSMRIVINYMCSANYIKCDCETHTRDFLF
jgi:hypothetical protein